MPHSTAPVSNGLAETGTRRNGRGYAGNYKATLDVPIKARAKRRKTGKSLMALQIDNRVLVVDDSAIYRHLITGHLKRWGFDLAVERRSLRRTRLRRERTIST